MSRILLLLASVVWAGCSLLPGDSTRVIISDVVLESVPMTQQNGAAWDADGGPDVYFQIQDAPGRVIVGSTVWNDVTGLPLHQLRAEGKVSRVSADLYFNVVDYDPGRVEDMIEAVRFSLADYAEERPTEVVLVDPDKGFQARLTLQWLD